MRAVIQRVNKASVKVNNQLISSISRGLLVLLGVGKGDSEQDAQYLADKTANLRIFEDEEGKMNLSLIDIKGDIMVISQFTLYGDCRKGRRPSFANAAKPDEAEKLYEFYVSAIKDIGLEVKTGIFQAFMEVELVNNGPVTILLDSNRNF
ncbi:D-tyrosyl-tRNA(Tyr) deacylase [Candidatus Poribacteria bacterium]|nr:D-tyrosyl-tRNA(Tyr) deacylase [Candidatus Poribacteria bacterium]